MHDPEEIPDSALKSLGGELAELLDDDQWNNIERRYLLPALEELKNARLDFQNACDVGRRLEARVEDLKRDLVAGAASYAGTIRTMDECRVKADRRIKALETTLNSIANLVSDAINKKIRTGRMPPIGALLSTIEDTARNSTNECGFARVIACDWCGAKHPMAEMEPEEAGEWICGDCYERDLKTHGGTIGTV